MFPVKSHRVNILGWGAGVVTVSVTKQSPSSQPTPTACLHIELTTIWRRWCRILQVRGSVLQDCSHF